MMQEPTPHPRPESQIVAEREAARGERLGRAGVHHPRAAAEPGLPRLPGPPEAVADAAGDREQDREDKPSVGSEVQQLLVGLPAREPEAEETEQRARRETEDGVREGVRD